MAERQNGYRERTAFARSEDQGRSGVGRSGVSNQGRPASDTGKTWPEMSGVSGETDRRKTREKTKERPPSNGKAGETHGMAKNMEEVAAVLKGLKFRKRFFGGVDEMDVWRQLEKLQKEYRSAYEAEQERNKALIRERDIQISQLKRLITTGNYGRGISDAQRQKET